MLTLATSSPSSLDQQQQLVQQLHHIDSIRISEVEEDVVPSELIHHKEVVADFLERPVATSSTNLVAQFSIHHHNYNYNHNLSSVQDVPLNLSNNSPIPTTTTSTLSRALLESANAHTTNPQQLLQQQHFHHHSFSMGNTSRQSSNEDFDIDDDDIDDEEDDDLRHNDSDDEHNTTTDSSTTNSGKVTFAPAPHLLHHSSSNNSSQSQLDFDEADDPVQRFPQYFAIALSSSQPNLLSDIDSHLATKVALSVSASPSHFGPSYDLSSTTPSELSSSTRSCVPTMQSGAPYRLLPEFMRRYHLRKPLGVGGTSFVFSAHRKSDVLRVAVKFLYKDRIPADGWKRDRGLGRVVPVEAFVLRRLDHPNIVKFYDLYEDTMFIYLVMEAVRPLSVQSRIRAQSAPASPTKTLQKELKHLHHQQVSRKSATSSPHRHSLSQETKNNTGHQPFHSVSTSILTSPPPEPESPVLTERKPDIPVIRQPSQRTPARFKRNGLREESVPPATGTQPPSSTPNPASSLTALILAQSPATTPTLPAQTIPDTTTDYINCKSTSTTSLQVPNDLITAAAGAAAHVGVVPHHSARRRTSHDLFGAIELLHSKGMSESRARRVFSQIVEAVAYMHSKGYCHRDLKDENVIVDHKMRVKLIDFGTAQIVTDPIATQSWPPNSLPALPPSHGGSSSMKQFSEFVGSLPYISPEIIRGERYSGVEHDLWCLGTLLYVLLESRYPFPDPPASPRTERPLLFRVPGRSEAVKELVHRLLEPEPARRMTMAELKLHRWLAPVHVE